MRPRGADVQGQNLVRSLWLPQGLCSLPAARLGEVPAGSAREVVAAAVKEAYAHASAAQRDRLTRAHHIIGAAGITVHEHALDLNRPPRRCWPRPYRSPSAWAVA